ncbi:unnamed protein product [Didymodactylos carnosus]|uniref:Uncharacterized protein n=1 Tax=Didymodactylos carnosus TaxID=1234261 RepID=A0A814TDM0_9BILA|nr:unnamed protein product [Didymodactylos carnosus]CAF1156806.1 unnamed protein product [Didymodactylos carnosus]CAF3729329.1 unnamed protein product [Didymodactylos carnosus]CAF3920248.1 unnamed protein product [Didymodactylos carnosus]
MPPLVGIEVKRTKLQNPLNAVSSKATDGDFNNDFRVQALKRRKQRRRKSFLSKSDSNDSSDSSDLITEDQQRHSSVVHRNDRPGSNSVRLRYNPYIAGTTSDNIVRPIPVKLRRTYSPNSDEEPPSLQRVSRSRTEPNQVRQNDIRAKTAISNSSRRSHAFETDHIDSTKVQFPSQNDGRQPSAFTNTDRLRKTSDTNNNDRFHRSSYEDRFGDNRQRRNDYRDEYLTTKQSVANTKNFISAIQDELRNIDDTYYRANEV